MRLWLIGDSITFGLVNPVTTQAPWEWHVEGRAVGGRTTLQMTADVLPEILATQTPPDVAVIQGGGNDLVQATLELTGLGWDGQTAEPPVPLPAASDWTQAKIAQRLVALAGQVEARGGKAILALPVGLAEDVELSPYAQWFQARLTEHRNALCGMPCRAVNLRCKTVAMFFPGDPFHPSSETNEGVLAPRVISKVKQVLGEESYSEACEEE